MVLGSARNLAAVEFPAETMAAMCFAGPSSEWHRTTRGLPTGAVLVGVNYEPWKRSFVLTFEHPDFRTLQPGEMVPRVDYKHEPQFACLSGVTFDQLTGQTIIHESYPGSLVVVSDYGRMTDEVKYPLPTSEPVVYLEARPMQSDSPADAPHIATG